MHKLQAVIRQIDAYQKQHKFLAFPYAVIKKYGEDEAGQQAALLTYYAFLALFPLLLVLTTVVEVIVGRHSHLETTVIGGITNYFPLLGTQLSAHIHGLHRSGLALAAGIIFTLYGARGVADAFRRGVQHIWHIPKSQQAGFPKSVLSSLGIIIIGGIGLMLASLSAAFTAAAGHGLAFRSLAVAVNLFVLFWLLTILINFSLPRHVTLKEIRVGAITGAIGLVILQSLGSYLLARELKNLDALYSYFAVALGLLFWIYLQAQVLYYAVELAVVSSQRLWPRSLDAALPTPVDKKLATQKNKY